jgi:hypothetical protein
MPFINVGELFGNYLIIVEKGVAWMLALSYLLLAIYAMYLANKPQPVPSKALWTSPPRTTGRRGRR